jgi:hypothetical protein
MLVGAAEAATLFCPATNHVWRNVFQGRDFFALVRGLFSVSHCAACGANGDAGTNGLP